MTADTADNRNTNDLDAATWLAWFDGAAHPNPGKIGIGGVIISPTGEVTNLCSTAGHGDSSDAEYRALVAVLKAALALDAKKLVVYGDSRVVIDDVQTHGACAFVLTHYREEARTLLAQFAEIRFVWIPRKKNTAADALSQQAVRQFQQ